MRKLKKLEPWVCYFWIFGPLLLLHLPVGVLVVLLLLTMTRAVYGPSTSQQRFGNQASPDAAVASDLVGPPLRLPFAHTGELLVMPTLFCLQTNLL